MADETAGVSANLATSVWDGRDQNNSGDEGTNGEDTRKWASCNWAIGTPEFCAGDAARIENCMIRERGTYLTVDMINDGLSDLRRNLTNGKYTFTRLTAQNKAIARIEELKSFIHLRSINLSQNQITDLKPLSALAHLEVLNAAENCIQYPEDVPVSEHLKHLNLRKNKLTRVAGFPLNSITHLDIRENLIDDIEGLTKTTFTSLTSVELRGNRLTSLKGINLPKLNKLYAAENSITALDGISCPELQVLHLRGNKISRLQDLPALAQLEYLNLRENKVQRFTETAYLIHAHNIRTLVLSDNPISKSFWYRREIVVALPHLLRLDKTRIPEVELEEGRRIFCARMKGKLPPVTDDVNVLSMDDAGDNDANLANILSPNVQTDVEFRSWCPPNTPAPAALQLITILNPTDELKLTEF